MDFHKLGMCIHIVEIWFGIANGQTLSILTELSAHHTIVAGYYHFMVFFFPLYNTQPISIVSD